MSRTIVAGNWKMNLGPAEARAFFGGFRPRLPSEGAPEILVFPPALSLEAVMQAAPSGLGLAVGIQNLYWEPSGAFTGEISAPMAREAGATHALVGHSERRQLFGETDPEVALKAKAASEAGLVPVVCVGETLEERRSGRLQGVLSRQLGAVMPHLQEALAAQVLLAYEPVWAIGTGETATPGDASQAHVLLREILVDGLGPENGEAIPILYGGSVKPDNARALMEAPYVDGVLVGGASLDPGSFSSIVEAAVAGPEVVQGGE